MFLYKVWAITTVEMWRDNLQPQSDNTLMNKGRSNTVQCTTTIQIVIAAENRFAKTPTDFSLQNLPAVPWCTEWSTNTEWYTNTDTRITGHHVIFVIILIFCGAVKRKIRPHWLHVKNRFFSRNEKFFFNFFPHNFCSMRQMECLGFGPAQNREDACVSRTGSGSDWGFLGLKFPCYMRKLIFFQLSPSSLNVITRIFLTSCGHVPIYLCIVG